MELHPTEFAVLPVLPDVPALHPRFLNGEHWPRISWRRDEQCQNVERQIGWPATRIADLKACGAVMLVQPRNVAPEDTVVSATADDILAGGHRLTALAPSCIRIRALSKRDAP